MQTLLRSIQQNSSLTQAEIATLVGVSSATINHLMSRRRFPSFPTLLSLIELAFSLNPSIDLEALFMTEANLV